MQDPNRPLTEAESAELETIFQTRGLTPLAALKIVPTLRMLESWRELIAWQQSKGR